MKSKIPHSQQEVVALLRSLRAFDLQSPQGLVEAQSLENAHPSLFWQTLSEQLRDPHTPFAQRIHLLLRAWPPAQREEPIHRYLSSNQESERLRGLWLLRALGEDAAPYQAFLLQCIQTDSSTAVRALACQILAAHGIPNESLPKTLLSLLSEEEMSAHALRAYECLFGRELQPLDALQTIYPDLAPPLQREILALCCNDHNGLNETQKTWLLGELRKCLLLSEHKNEIKQSLSTLTPHKKRIRAWACKQAALLEKEAAPLYPLLLQQMPWLDLDGQAEILLTLSAGGEAIAPYQAEIHALWRQQEAAPLYPFVAMALIACQKANEEQIQFLQNLVLQGYFSYEMEAFLALARTQAFPTQLTGSLFRFLYRNLVDVFHPSHYHPQRRSFLRKLLFLLHRAHDSLHQNAKPEEESLRNLQALCTRLAIRRKAILSPSSIDDQLIVELEQAAQALLQSYQAKQLEKIKEAWMDVLFDDPR